MDRTNANVIVAIVFCFCATLRPEVAWTQVTTGSLAGTVRDATGGVLPGASVVLISDTRQTRSNPVVTNAAGDFVFPAVAPDTYTVQIEMPTFRTVRRSGVQVSPGDRASIILTMEIGGANETVTVTGEVSQIQASSGERSFTVSSTQLENLPMPRSFQQFAALTPGTNGVQRAGGGGESNFMIDGVVVMDPGNNGLALSVNVDTISEVKVLTSGYQAEYGRSSGLQITAVTKSGTNRFRGSAYDIERNSDWNSNSKVNILNGDPKPVSKNRDFGFTIGGPVGRPGRNNKLFFFYAHEVNPRSSGNDVVRFRVPTALERQGDFSKTVDQNGLPYPYIKDPRLPGACSAATQAGCFADQGLLGRIPSDQLYQPGLAILNWWPAPNIDGAGLAYNYELTRPVEKIVGQQPILKVDYLPRPSLRVSGKMSLYTQGLRTFNGVLPGFTDARPSWMTTPALLGTVSYTINPSTFFEATLGRSYYAQEGCTVQGGPAFCTAALPMADRANFRNAGFGGLPLLYPEAQILDPSYRFIEILEKVGSPVWDGSRLWRSPSFAWGNRIANSPPAPPWPGFFQSGGTWDLSSNITKVYGSHTFKAGYYYQYELHYRNGGPANWNGTVSFANDPVGTNPFDTSFGFANAAIGAFSSYTQVSKYLEGYFRYDLHEFYVQDNWKLNPRLTLDYGLRFTNQQPYMDERRQGSNFYAEQWNAVAAPALYQAGCVGSSPCSGADRRALNSRTGQILGPQSSVAIGTLVPNSGSTTNGTTRWGEDGTSSRGYSFPALGVAPRFGMAYDVTGAQNTILRGGVGLFYDLPSGNAQGTYNAIGGPGVTESAAVRFSTLQSFATSGLRAISPPGLTMYEAHSPLPASLQFNAGIQRVLPWATTVDASYVGIRSYNLPLPRDINAIDIGTAFLPASQDPTVPASLTPGATSVAALNPDLARSFQGYSSILLRAYDGSRTYHSIQLSFNRRMANGFSFGFSDTIGLYDKSRVAPRIQHDTAGTYTVRSDDSTYQELLGNNNPTQLLKANFVWQLPKLETNSGARRIVGAVTNGWQLSGVWLGSTGAAYVVGFNYTNGGSSVNLTGSPDYGARVRIVGDPGSGCSSDPYRQFNTAAFQGPAAGSDGLESGNNYVRGCFQSTLDLSLARNIALGGGRTLQLRVDLFNAPNAAIITNRNTTLNLSNPNDPVTINNLPVDSAGNVIESRSRPRGAGAGVATNYQAPRSVQAQIRFSF